MNSDEKHIIKKCLAKDKQAEKELFYSFSPFVFSICIRYSTDHSHAKDYLQECFLHIFRKLDKYDSGKGRLESWIRKLCINKILELKRSTELDKFQVPIDDLELEYEQTHQFDETDIDKQIIIQAIQKLPEGYRTIVNLHLIEGWSHDEISESLQIKASTSRSQLTRAKVQLRKIILKSIPDFYEKRLA